VIFVSKNILKLAMLGEIGSLFYLVLFIFPKVSNQGSVRSLVNKVKSDKYRFTTDDNEINISKCMHFILK
jgi:hypothetical protein